MMGAQYFWIIYFIVLIPSFVCFYRFAYLVPKGQLADSIVMENGEKPVPGKLLINCGSVYGV